MNVLILNTQVPFCYGGAEVLAEDARKRVVFIQARPKYMLIDHQGCHEEEGKHCQDQTQNEELPGRAEIG